MKGPHRLAPSPRRVPALLVAGTLLSLSPAALAQEPRHRAPVPVHAIAVELESGCVTADEFFREVKRRTERVREVKPGELGRRVRVTIEEAERVVGRLLVTTSDGAIIAREVEGATCREVIEALALVLAVTLDPPSPGTTVQRSPPAAPSPPPPPASAAALASRPPVAPLDRAARYRHFAGGEALVFARLIERPLAGLGARYAVARDGPGTRMLFTLGAFATFPSDVAANYPVEGALIRFRLHALEAGVCPIGVLLHPKARLYPCAAVTVGRLQAEGIGLPGQRADAAPFVAVSLNGRATVEVFGPVALSGAAGLSVPLGKYSAVVTGAGERAGEVQVLGIALYLGLVARFP